ncbi:MAG: DUF6279 family lipoprotein [Burkholderiales bacterium]|nr:DUF6279 family lipoprotein [Burkholderiales bacterium]
MSDRLRSTASLAILLAFLLATLTGCSMIRLGYSQADTIAAWKADEYFDFDSRQKDEFFSRFERLYDWHRYEQLPEYAAFIGAVKTRLHSGLRREDVLWFLEGLKTRYRLIASRGANDAAEILATLTPAQLDALQRQWVKVNRKFIREYKLEDTPREQQRAQAKRMLSRIEDWTGSLSHEQEQKITALCDKLPLTDHLRHEDRLRRQREFLRLLELRGNPGEFTPRLRHWLLNWEEGRAPEYERLYAPWLEQRVQFMVDVYSLLTPTQRAHVQHRLQNYIEDFKKLSEHGERTAAR